MYKRQFIQSLSPLPVSVGTYIFTFLSLRDRPSLARTCRSARFWNQQIASYRTALIGDEASVLPLDLFNTLLPRVRALEVTNNISPLRVWPSMPHLTELNLERCTAWTVHQLLENKPNLTCLSLDYCEWELKSDATSTGTRPTSMFANRPLPSLTNLEIFTDDEIAPSDPLLDLCATGTRFTSFTFFSKRDNTAFVSGVAPTFGHLQSLHLTITTDGTFLPNLAKHCPQLQNLFINTLVLSCYTDLGLLENLQSLTLFTTLRGPCHPIYRNACHANLFQTIERMSKLQCLALSFDHRVEVMDMAGFPRSLTVLRLDPDNLPNIAAWPPNVQRLEYIDAPNEVLTSLPWSLPVMELELVRDDKRFLPHGISERLLTWPNLRCVYVSEVCLRDPEWSILRLRGVTVRETRLTFARLLDHCRI